MWSTEGVVDTGLQFAGTFFGDHAKTGIGLRLSTGTVIGAGANVMDAMPPKCVRPFAWGTGAPYAAFAASKFAETAARVMWRREVAWTENDDALWRAVRAAADADRRWPDDRA
jgi:hypothetical protein